MLRIQTMLARCGRSAVLLLPLALFAGLGCRYLDFPTACSEDPAKCDENESGVDSSADVTVDSSADIGVDVATDSLVDSGVDAGADSRDAVADIADGCVCAPDATEPVSGTCPSVGDVHIHRCDASCAWAAPECVTPSGWRKMAATTLGMRRDAAVVWTGTQLIVWSGVGLEGYRDWDDGAVYTLATDTWKPMATSPLSGRHLSAVVWNGTSMLVWGGAGGAGPGVSESPKADGAAYDPGTDTWTPLPASTLSARSGAAAAWSTTTNELLVWGGATATGFAADGIAYKPSTKWWRALDTSPLSVRAVEIYGWSGTELVVWGGSSTIMDGARFNPFSGVWTMLPAAPFSDRGGPGAAFAGSELFLFGGTTGSFFVDDGARIKMGATSWTAIPHLGGTSLYGFRAGSATWSDGKKLWVWSGYGEYESVRKPAEDGATLDLAAGVWALMPTAPIAGRQKMFSAWTGKSAIIWGGQNASATLTDGAIYTP